MYITVIVITKINKPTKNDLLRIKKLFHQHFIRTLGSIFLKNDKSKQLNDNYEKQSKCANHTNINSGLSSKTYNKLKPRSRV